MSQFTVFLGSVVIAAIGFALLVTSLVRSGSFKVSATASDVAAVRAHRRWIVVGVVLLGVCLAAAVLFLYIWYYCVGEC